MERSAHLAYKKVTMRGALTSHGDDSALGIADTEPSGPLAVDYIGDTYSEELVQVVSGPCVWKNRVGERFNDRFLVCKRRICPGGRVLIGKY